MLHLPDFANMLKHALKNSRNKPLGQLLVLSYGLVYVVSIKSAMLEGMQITERLVEVMLTSPYSPEFVRGSLLLVTLLLLFRIGIVKKCPPEFVFVTVLIFLLVILGPASRINRTQAVPLVLTSIAIDGQPFSRPSPDETAKGEVTVRSHVFIEFQLLGLPADTANIYLVFAQENSCRVAATARLRGRTGTVDARVPTVPFPGKRLTVFLMVVASPVDEGTTDCTGLRSGSLGSSEELELTKALEKGGSE